MFLNTVVSPSEAEAADTTDLEKEVPAASPPEAGALLLNGSWKFHQGEISLPLPKTHRGAYDYAKAEGAVGPAARTYDDIDWQVIHLPHDWAIFSKPDPAESVAQGYRKRGFGWYRRTFKIDQGLRGRYLEIQLEGIATNSTVWFNGNLIARNSSAYISLYLDITSLAEFGEAVNTLAVHVDASDYEGWWYEGAGIYKNAWLVHRSPVHIETDGIYYDPRLNANGKWLVPVEVSLNSIADDAVNRTITVSLVDREGVILAQAAESTLVAPLASTLVKLSLPNLAPRLWSIDDPYLHDLIVQVREDERVIHERVLPCGFRSIHFDADKGFFLNGASTKIKGTCVHQDHAGLGVAVPPAIVFWRMQQLKAIGCNAIRSAHNPPSLALLDACDRLGMLVLDENRHFNDSPEYLAQLEWLVRRDRNRPCVVLWSIYNEEQLGDTDAGYQMARRLVRAIKSLDDGRPVTAALTGGLLEKPSVADTLDLVGFNYQYSHYDDVHIQRPGQPITSTEDTSGFMTRGVWKTDLSRQMMASDDTQYAAWGSSQRQGWKEIDTRPYIAGSFVWTGFDYLGEPTPFEWPANGSYFGLFDHCGFPKAAAFMREALWRKDRPVLKILRAWEGNVGESLKVIVATNLDKVDLFVNGNAVGSSVVRPYDFPYFMVEFVPGAIEARGWKGGKMVARHAVQSPGVAQTIRLKCLRSTITGDGFDAVPVAIELVDRVGIPVSNVNAVVTIAVTNGHLIGVGNGDPTSLASGKENIVTLFNGLAQAIVQTEADSIGMITVEVAADGLQSAKLDLTIHPATLSKVAPGPKRFFISNWIQSPLVAVKPVSPPMPARGDVNSWKGVVAGVSPPWSANDGYITLESVVELPKEASKLGAWLVFESVSGAGDLWINGKIVAMKRQFESSELRAQIPSGLTDLNVALILRGNRTVRTGLPGQVYLEIPEINH